MCYTIKIDYTREELERQFGAKFNNNQQYASGERISAFSLPTVPVICNDNTNEIRTFTWGLIPFWVKDLNSAKEIRMKTFNARCESLAEKASFRHSFGQKRCLVLVNGFYEWQTNDKQKIPFFIRITDRSAFALAGLYDTWKNPHTGELLNTFTVVTTRANPMLEIIHNTKKRMPVILSPENQETWLDLQIDPSACGLFEPYPEDMMYSEQVTH